MNVRFAWGFSALCAIGLGLATPVGAERADRGKPVNLEADRVRVDDRLQSQVFEGDVRLAQGTLEIRAEKLVVAQDRQGFQRGTAWGKPGAQASFRQKREGRAEYVEGQADRIEHDGVSAITDFIGKARVTSGQDEVTGEHIRYDGKKETYTVSGRDPAAAVNAAAAPAGRVRAVIQPASSEDGQVDPAPVPAPAPPAR